MGNEELSAFAAYSGKKTKKKSGIGVGFILKSKYRLKKKKKSQKNNANSVVNTLMKVKEPNTLNNLLNKSGKKNFAKKDLIKSILGGEKESIFKDCNLTTEVENVFLNTNCISEESTSKKNKNSDKIIKNSDNQTELKKKKKKKVETEIFLNGKSSNSFPSDTESTDNVDGETNKKSKNKNKNAVLNNEVNKISPKNLKDLAEKNSDNKTKFKKRKKKKGKTEIFLNGKSSNRFPSDTESSDNVNSERNKKLKKKHKNADLNDEVNKISQKNLKDLAEPVPELSQLIYSDSIKIGEEVFSWLLTPMNIKDFFNSCWEQKPLHIAHNNENYYKCICTLEDFKEALRENDMYFTRNIDVTSYVNGERFTENPEGKAKPPIVWDLYKKGKSIRLLNPQTFIPNIRILNSTLQEFFQCFVGANIYLTPPGTQGFAPHYDDIEAFVLQLEGEKQWKLYNPRSPEEVLPRESSRNFCEDEIGEPILEVTLRPGDLLYFPRGIIHQAKCLPHVHSLHVTVSCYQKNSWADLLEKVLPVALQKAISEDVEFRKGLPIGCLNHLGMVHTDQESAERGAVIAKFEQLVQKVLDHCPLDAGVDQVGAGFMHDALPPSLTEEEKSFGADRNHEESDQCLLDALINLPNRKLGVKFIRGCCARLVSEGEDMVLYYTTDNSLVYREHEVCSAEVPTHWAQAIDFLLRSYPKFVDMKDLPVCERFDEPPEWNQIADFVYFLWQKGLVFFDRPLREICS